MRISLILPLLCASCMTFSPVKDGVAPLDIYRHETVQGESVHLLEVDFNDFAIRPIRSTKKLSTTSQLAKDHDAFAAINGGYFQEDGTPSGLMIVDKEILGYQGKPRAALGWTRDMRQVLLDRILFTKSKPQFTSLTGWTTANQWEHMDFALGGTPLLVHRHKAVSDFDAEKVRKNFLTLKHARTAVCVKSADMWILVVVDGSSSLQLFGDRRGFTMPELAEFMESRLHCDLAVNLDGGGSSSMVLETKLLNNPTYGERPVADALGVFFKKPCP